MPKRFRSIKRRRSGGYRKRRFVGRRRRYARVPRRVRSSVELKWLAGAQVLRPQATAAGMSASCINALQQGVQRFNRIGAQVVNKWYNITFSMIAGNVLLSQRVRIIAFVDKQPNRSTPTVGGNPFDLLFSDPTPANFHYSPYHSNYVGKGKRIKIIKDKKYTLDIEGGANNIVKPKYVTWNLKFRSKTYYVDTTVGDVTDIETNAIWVVLFSDQTVAADTPIIGVSYKFMYKDA